VCIGRAGRNDEEIGSVGQSPEIEDDDVIRLEIFNGLDGGLEQRRKLMSLFTF
jgi:hypothetical protein